MGEGLNRAAEYAKTTLVLAKDNPYGTIQTASAFLFLMTRFERSRYWLGEIVGNHVSNFCFTSLGMYAAICIQNEVQKEIQGANLPMLEAINKVLPVLAFSLLLAINFGFEGFLSFDNIQHNSQFVGDMLSAASAIAVTWPLALYQIRNNAS